MKTNKIEKAGVVLLFALVLIVFSLAERDSKKLDRLYKTTQLLNKGEPTPTVQMVPASAKSFRN